MELAEWLAERVRCVGIKAPLATLFGRAMSGGIRSTLGATWSETPIQPLGNWPGSRWQEVARLADLASNREAMARLLARRNPASIEAISAIRDLLGATEEDFRERAGWEWVLEAAVRRSREPQLEVVAALGTLRMATPADARIPATLSAEWPVSPPLGELPLQRAASR